MTKATMTNEVTWGTQQIIEQLYNGGHPNKGVLAGLRQATNMTHPKAQVAWPIMMATVSTMPTEISNKILSKNGQPTKAERSIYAAIRLYAIYQQGIAEPVYGRIDWKKADKDRKDQAEPEPDKVVVDQPKKLLTGQTLFQALAQLRLNSQLKEALDRRVETLLASTNIEAILDALGHLVSMLKARSRDVRVDYGQLARDFYQIQLGYVAANRVRLRWGQQYFFVPTKTTQKGNESNEE